MFWCSFSTLLKAKNEICIKTLKFLTCRPPYHRKRHQEWWNGVWQVRNVSVLITIFLKTLSFWCSASILLKAKNKIFIITLKFLTFHPPYHRERHQEWWSGGWQVWNFSILITIFFLRRWRFSTLLASSLKLKKIVIKTLTFLTCHPLFHHYWWRSRWCGGWKTRNFSVIICYFLCRWLWAVKTKKDERKKKKEGVLEGYHLCWS